jgi:hypothetical protein
LVNAGDSEKRESFFHHQRELRKRSVKVAKVLKRRMMRLLRFLKRRG